MTDAKQQLISQIQAQAEESWTDPAFEPRDESAINLARFGSETETDPRFAPLASDTPMSLRNQLTRMVRESQSDPELRHQLSEAGVELPRTSWRFYSQGWTVDIALQGGWWIVAATNDDSGEKRHFKLQDTQAGDRDEAMAAVGRVLNQDTPRTIPESDRLRIERMAAGGNLPEALAEYILLRLPARCVLVYISQPGRIVGIGVGTSIVEHCQDALAEQRLPLRSVGEALNSAPIARCLSGSKLGCDPWKMKSAARFWG